MRKIFYLLLVFMLVLFACSAGCTSSTTKQEVLTQEEFQEKMDARAATNTPTTVSTTKPTTVPTTIPTTVPTVRKTPTPTPTIAYQDGEFKFALLMSSEEIIGVLGDIGSDLENSRYNSFFADGVILKKTAREQKNLLSSYRVSSSLQDTKTYYLQALDYCISCGGNIETAGKYYREDNLDLFATYMEKATSDMKNIGYYISLATKSIK